MSDETGREDILEALRQLIDVATPDVLDPAMREILYRRVEVLQELADVDALEEDVERIQRAMDQGAAKAAAAGRYDEHLYDMAEKLRIRKQAGDIVAEEEANKVFAASGFDAPLDVNGLLQAYAEEEQWIVAGLMEAGGRVLVEAQYKAGKTTLVQSLANDLLVGGHPFLGVFDVEALAEHEAIVYVDTEVGGRALARMLKANIAEVVRHRLRVIDLRARGGSVDIRADAVRNRVVQTTNDSLRRAGLTAAILIVDVASAWMAPLGIDENSNTDVRGFLEYLDRLGRELGVRAVVLTHHSGHMNSERGRGASAFRDWASAVWTVYRSADDSPIDSPRFFRADGRDVHVEEAELVMGPLGTLALRTGKTRKTTRASENSERIRTDITTLLAGAQGGMSTKEIQIGVRGGDGVIRAELDWLVQQAYVERTQAPGTKGGGGLSHTLIRAYQRTSDADATREEP